MLLDLKTLIVQTVTNIMNVMTSLIQTHTCTIAHYSTDLITIIGHVYSTIEPNRQDHIAGCIDSHYRRISKNVPSYSDWLFGNDITRRVMTIATKKKLLNNKSTSFTILSSSLNKNSKNFR